MSDLISRQDAIDLVKHRMKHNPMKSVEFIQGLQDAYLRVLSDLNALPPAERKGEWIWSPKDIDGTVSGCCSNCSFSHLFIGGHTAQFNYCPNCGAYMRGDTDEQIH